ncbi:hypothetical protein FNW02_37485 [Komarekiella sp. 'clone 1']|uniref:Uncharacterized protein n=1 Tax=Komarekiella delphini-convector SJRDD-AB1 TaxID=2593771 RepID=A0AA41BAM2_9NOST|nr:hypothetical protein [Komarekiella delphini-convector]MBD6621236.1 hypothetical protein [Komarekiella delphini-convector SJRDD-AB1]
MPTKLLKWVHCLSGVNIRLLNRRVGEKLGEYIDRLMVKEIIAIAQTYSAGSIVIPKLDNIREQV